MIFDKRIYGINNLECVLTEDLKQKIIGNNKGVYYYNFANSFDIETTSFIFNGEKRALMYVWQLEIYNKIIVGRTWTDFVTTLNKIAKFFETNEKRILIIYVHNLSYEFQFMRKWFKWEKVFSIDDRKPIYAITDKFIEFRCSYLLSGYSLSNLSNQLLTHSIKKLNGFLDYEKMRHTKTALTDEELSYCINDVKVVCAYIDEKIEIENGITNLPLTKTGAVRKYCRKRCLYTGKHYINTKYNNLMRKLIINDLEEFTMLQRAFTGGFTHANSYYSGETLRDVTSFDFTSSYPYVMLSEKFPMSAGVKIEIDSKEKFLECIDKYCCVFDVTFFNLLTTDTNENPISEHKALRKVNTVVNNGRVVSADVLTITVTNIDYEIYKNFYSWDSMTIGKFYIYKKDYLPTEFINCILDFYEDKTTLKGVQGKEVEYLKGKENVNSCYGMAVTSPLRDEFLYCSDWETHQLSPEDKKEKLEKYNNSKSRFLFYPWGIFVTAYARRNLFTGIKSVGSDYVYSDTDSIKLINADAHKDYFTAYNLMVDYKLMRACKHHGIDIKRTAPKTVKGEIKKLGIWDFDGHYERFKTLGAKRYLVEKENAINIDGISYNHSLTVAGLNKNTAIPYLEKQGKDIFTLFNNGLSIPKEETGKNTHTYIDYEIGGFIVDYKGAECEYYEKSCINLDKAPYELSLSTQYVNYLKSIKTNIM